MKTRARIELDVRNYQCQASITDTGYIDGYVRGGDSVPRAAFVNDKDGSIELVPIHCLRAIHPED